MTRDQERRGPQREVVGQAEAVSEDFTSLGYALKALSVLAASLLARDLTEYLQKQAISYPLAQTCNQKISVQGLQGYVQQKEKKEKKKNSKEKRRGVVWAGKKTQNTHTHTQTKVVYSGVRM